MSPPPEPTPASEPRAVSVAMLKGGTTKSTVAANIAEALGTKRAGNRTLAIDFDPNGHLTANLGYASRYHQVRLCPSCGGTLEVVSRNDNEEVYDPSTNAGDWPADAVGRCTDCGDLVDDYKDRRDIGDVILPAGSADPEDVIVDTSYGFDLLPSSVALETVNSSLRNEVEFGPSRKLKDELVDPLLGDTYDYIVIDTHSNRNMLTNNAVVAAPELIMPLVPEQGIYNGLTRTRERIIRPLRDRLGLDVLAVVPNKLSARMDHENDDHDLIRKLVTTPGLRDRVPNFAYIPPDDLEQLRAGTWVGDLPKPGLRMDKDLDRAFKQNQTLGAFNGENPQLASFDELARIVERGGVMRDD